MLLASSAKSHSTSADLSRKAIEEPLMRDGNVFTVEEPIGGVAFF